MKNSISKKFIHRLSSSPYVSNDLLNLIDKIEKEYGDEHLAEIRSIFNRHIILEDYNRRPLKEAVSNVATGIHLFQSWADEKNIDIIF